MRQTSRLAVMATSMLRVAITCTFQRRPAGIMQQVSAHQISRTLIRLSPAHWHKLRSRTTEARKLAPRGRILKGSLNNADMRYRNFHIDVLNTNPIEGETIMFINQQHLELLKKGGATTWNIWRQSHPATVPELHGADLRGADLSECNLSTANLREANLSNANLSASDLIEANLNGANLANADLSGAHMIEAKLEFCDLRGANLANADLTGADLSGANLMTANLSGANLNYTRLTD